MFTTLINFLLRKPQLPMTYKGVEFGVRRSGGNLIEISNSVENYYVFVEYLRTEPISVLLDTSKTWHDRGLSVEVDDAELNDFLLKMAISYFKDIGIDVK